LGPPRFEEAALLEQRQHGLQQQVFHLALNEAGAELAQDRGIKARIGQLEGEGIFPIDASAHSVGGLAVGQAFCELHHQHQRQPCGLFRWLSGMGKQASKLRIVIEGAKGITHLHEDVAFRKGGMSDTDSFFRNRRAKGRTHGHRTPPRATQP
jgi:hypothetical protein